MLEILISSSVLILVLAILRLVLRDKISARLQYALWLLVLVRLLVPVSFFHSPVSVAEAASPMTEQAWSASQRVLYTWNTPGSSPRESAGVPTPPDEGGVINSGDVLLLRDALLLIWNLGMVVMAVWFLFVNMRLVRRLKKNRTPYDCPSVLPVYVTEVVPSPCLFGLVRPSIYLTERAAEDADGARQIVTHELTHYRHGDVIWALLRSVCLVVWWFNPLVWLAAALARQDCELACDEGTIKALGEDARFDYGRTLVGMAAIGARPSDLLCGATTMTTGKKSLRERVARIANAPKMSVTVAVIVLIIAAVVVGCTYSGAKQNDVTAEPVEPEVAMEVPASASATDVEAAGEPTMILDPETGDIMDGMTREAEPIGGYDREYWEEVDREFASFLDGEDVELYISEYFDEALPEDDVFGPLTLADYIYGTDGWKFEYNSEFPALDPDAQIIVYDADGRALWIEADMDALMIEEADGSVTRVTYAGDPVDCTDMIRHLLPWARGEYPTQEQMLIQGEEQQAELDAIVEELGHYGFSDMTEYHISGSEIMYDNGVIYNLPEWASVQQGISAKTVHAAYGTETENIDLQYERFWRDSTNTTLVNAEMFDNARAYYRDVLARSVTDGLQVNGHDAYVYYIPPYDAPAIMWYDADAELIFHLTEYSVGTDPQFPPLDELIALAESVTAQ